MTKSEYIGMQLSIVVITFASMFMLHMSYNVIKFWFVLIISLFVSPLVAHYFMKKELYESTAKNKR